MKFNQGPDLSYTAFLPVAVREVYIYKITSDMFVVKTADWNGGTVYLNKETNESVPDCDNYNEWYSNSESLLMLLTNHMRAAEKVIDIIPKGRQLLTVGDYQTYTTPIEVNGQPVFISQNITDESCLVFIGHMFVEHVLVQERLEMNRTQEAPF
jgi:hypothetical protein